MDGIEPLLQVAFRHGILYRPVDLATPWVGSPRARPMEDGQSPAKFESFEDSLPFRIVPIQPAESSPKTDRQRTNKFWGLLQRWIGSREAYQTVSEIIPSPTTPPVVQSRRHLGSLRSLMPREVELDEWKAWGYYAYPYVNDVFVRNYPANPSRPSAGVSVEELIAGLRSPHGTRHPERWIPGIVHPSLPPRPSRWVEPIKGEPIPFPWECQLNPYLEHITLGPPPLCWNIGRPTTSIMSGSTQVTIPLQAADKCQPATWPLVTHMYINAIADDPLPVFLWPIMVHNPLGVKCEDIYEAIYRNFQEHVTQREYDSWEALRRRPANLAFEVRGGPAQNDRLRRVDYLGTHHMFRGLEPNPNREGWIMFVGLA